MSEKILVKLKGEDDKGCPAVTPTQLLEEKSTPQDLVALEYVMGRFTSTTEFLGALKQVLIGLEGFAEANALDQFLPLMALVESNAMNGEPTSLQLESTISNTERILRIHRSDDLTDYPRVENGELLNSGEVSPSPNG